jgi:N-acetylated-alpha-linked acidic dipeptidase
MNVRLCWSEFLWLSPEIGILIRMFVILLSPQEANAADTALQVRRFCTVFLITVPLLALAIVFFGVAIGGDNDLFGDRGHLTTSDAPHLGLSELPHPSWPQSDGLSYSELKDILLKTPSADKAREWSKYYTAGPHLAGKNLSQAEWTRDRWEEWGVKSHIAAYNVYINYPVDHRLALLKEGRVDFEATLEEDVLEDDPTTGLEDRVPVFHGYSASGNATAQYVYVNYGTYYDFEELVKAGIELKGKIALVKYGRIFRGLKVKRAEELGMLGVVIYSDPGDDGEITEENGYKPYPEGPARHPRAVQRGSVEYLSKFAPIPQAYPTTNTPCRHWTW